MEERILPHDLDAERVILGSILSNPKVINVASDLLLADDFYLEAHRIIFRSMLALAVDSVPIDLWTLKSELCRCDNLEKAGGLPVLVSLTDGMSTVANIPHYVRNIRQHSLARNLIQLGNQLMTDAWQPENNPKELLESAQQKLLQLYGRDQQFGPQKISAVIDRGVKELEARSLGSTNGTAIKTGFLDIDSITGGLRPGNLIIIAGRPGTGKSALAVNAAINMAHAGKRVVVFSLEMSETEIYHRVLSSETRIPVGKIIGGFISRDDWRLVQETNSRLSGTGIWIDDSGSITLMQLRARCQRIATEHGIDCAIIDYMQLIQGAGKSIYERVTEVSRGLKIMAKDLQIPIITLSQLHRLESENKEPNLFDLRESGAIEQDADVVMMLWNDGTAGCRKIKIAKQRNGPNGTFSLGWIPEQTKFTDFSARAPIERSFEYVIPPSGKWSSENCE